MLYAAILAGCSPLISRSPPTISPGPDSQFITPTLTLAPVPSFVNQTTPESGEERDFAVHLLFYLATAGPFTTGDKVTVTVEARPVVLSRLIGSTGEILGTSTVPWVDHAVTEMSLCLSWDQECVSEADWSVFQERQELVFDIDWIGARPVWLTARFRDRSLAPVPIFLGGIDLLDLAQLSLQVESLWNRSTPVEAFPAPIQTAVIQTQLAYPLTGSVRWEDGRCCAGGTAGDTIQVSADFSASSPHGDVVEMRVRTGSTCFTEEKMEQAAWEPFVPQRSFPFTLAINWVGFYITAQYRDLHGNLSPAFCDDISLEGMPPRTP